MQAIILAAGMGKRLKNLTQNNPKCMVDVAGKTLIERMLTAIDSYSLKRIVIVIGYKSEILKEYIATLNIKTPIVYVTNDVYYKTNNIYSLYLARDYLIGDDTLLFESDLIFSQDVLDCIINDRRRTLALVDKFESWMDGTCLCIDKNDNITDFITKSKFDYSESDKYYKSINIYKFSSDFSSRLYVPFLEAYQKSMGSNEYYENVLRVISILDKPEIKVKRLDRGRWYEIDDINDLKIAETLFAKDEHRLSLISARYGGYWRYPKLLDYCYLVNPYFPPQKLIDEIKGNFEILLRNYPSGMDVNSHLVSNIFNVENSHIVVGSGAAELIKECLREFSKNNGKFGIITPGFDEYKNRINSDNTICFDVSKRDFRYSKDDIINYFEDKNISTLILVNPNNPTGFYLSKNSIMEIAAWCDNKGISFILDESFVDFVSFENGTLIDESIIKRFNKLYIIKSISKSYGVPGLRLGVMVSSDSDMVYKIKKAVSIWNINSFAEFYLQIYNKYDSLYSQSLDHIIKDRQAMAEGLSSIKDLKVYPSEANYIMIQLPKSVKADEICACLYTKYNILAKPLTGKIKTGDYLRLAVRTYEENTYLIRVLKEKL